MMLANIQALTADEEGGIKLTYCIDSGSFNKNENSSESSNVCASGTSTVLGTPSYPMGTIYECSSEKGTYIFISARSGYCYEKQ